MHFLRALFLAVVFPGFCIAAISIEVGGGITESRLADYGRSFSDETHRIRFNADMGLELTVTPGFSVLPGLALEMRGERNQWRSDDDSPKFDEDTDLLYLQIPVLMLFRVPLGNARCQFFVGPSLGFPLAGKIKSRSEVFPDGRAEWDIKDWVKPEFATKAGVGVDFPMRRVVPFMRLVYHQGWTKVIDVPDDGRGAFGLNQAIDLKFGLNIPI
jgi:hypothetical protein